MINSNSPITFNISAFIRTIFFLFLLLLCTPFLFGQRGKNGSVTVNTSGSVVNSYTYLTANANQNSTQITANNATLTNAFLTSPLSAGDLVLIVQMQGATMDINVTPTASWGGSYTVPQVYFDVAFNTNPWEWGQILNYNQAGKFEYAQVASVAGNQINLTCGLQNNYVAAGHVQIVRVPRFSSLTVATGNSITAPTWDGNTGGIVAIEVDQNLTLQTNSLITVTGKGFRGGQSSDNTTDGSNSGSDPLEIGFYGSSSNLKGAEKGEGIGGFTTEYEALYSRYCKGAPANGGGGGNNHNAGGGGGANVGLAGTYRGYGVLDPAFTAQWNLEMTPIGGQTSTGGGRGGYTYSTSNQNEMTVGPNNNLWSGDKRRNEGGYGGHPLTYDPTRVFFGGGGGAGDQNFSSAPNQVGIGGNGGGIVFLQVYGSILGSGKIEANGANGGSSNPTNNTTPTVTQKFGNDGAGGAGAGGSIFISNNATIPTTIQLTANGGVGGNHSFYAGTLAPSPSMEADGPGGGGTGGLITYTAGTPSVQVNAGSNGISNSAHVVNFPQNGATSGNPGISNANVNFYDIEVEDSLICSNQAVTLTATVIGTLPSGTQVSWYTNQFSGSPIATGTTFTTPVISTTTTYYVGICPGDFRKPVTVQVGSTPVISGTVSITDESCSGNDGAISGLSASGGNAPLSYSWNAIATPGANLNGASAGSYTLTVTDAQGCTAESGPHLISNPAAPVIDVSAITITNSSCSGATGSITGITHTGGTTFMWNGATVNQLDISNLAAGSYTLTVTNASSCSSTAGPFTITSPTGPSINTTNALVTNATCGLNTGSITGITATGSNIVYSWNGTVSLGADTLDLGANTFTLTVTDDQGCVATAGPYTILNSTIPTIDVTNLVASNAACGQATGSISGIVVNGGTAPYSYTWTNTTQSTLALSNLAAGTYTLTVTDNLACSVSSSPIQIQSQNGPQIDSLNFVITNESCAGNDGSITGITATGTGLIYSWNGIVGTANLSNAIEGQYVLSVTDAANCTSFSGPYSILGATPIVINESNLSVNASACNSETGSISGITFTGGTNAQVSWNNGLNSDLNQANLGAGTYVLTISDSQGCTATASYTILLESGPSIDASSLLVTSTVCGENNGTIVGLALADNQASISWSNTTETSLDLSNLAPGTYTLTVTGVNGCQTIGGSYVINPSSGVVADFTYSPTTIAVGDNVVFTDQSSTNVSVWNWTIDNSNYVSQNANYTFTQEGIYTILLNVENAAGCTDQIAKTIQVGSDLIVPNVLTINADGINETFLIQGMDQEIELLIFNRWGNLVFSSFPYLNNWNGLDNAGNKLSEGVYTYLIKEKNASPIQGFIHLKMK